MVTGSLHGDDVVSRMTRRSIVRYAVLSYTITMISIAPSAKKRFPTMQHIVNAGQHTYRAAGARILHIAQSYRTQYVTITATSIQIYFFAIGN